MAVDGEIQETTVIFLSLILATYYFAYTTRMVFSGLSREKEYPYYYTSHFILQRLKGKNKTQGDVFTRRCLFLKELLVTLNTEY